MFDNPYGWSTNPIRLPGRTRKAGMWITAWVDYGRPVILDTRQLWIGHDAKRRIDFALDDERVRRYQGSDPFPEDSLLVLIHPQTYRDLLLMRHAMTMTGPDAAACFLDGACKQTPGLADRIGWAVLGEPIDGYDD